MHQYYVDGQPVKPRRKSGLTAKRPNLSVKLQERFLSQILGFGCIRSHPQAQRVDSPLMLVVQALERLSVTLFGPLDEISFDRIAGLSLFWVGQVAFSGRTP
jgi:hypothetical protein